MIPFPIRTWTRSFIFVALHLTYSEPSIIVGTPISRTDPNNRIPQIFQEDLNKDRAGGWPKLHFEDSFVNLRAPNNAYGAGPLITRTAPNKP